MVARRHRRLHRHLLNRADTDDLRWIITDDNGREKEKNNNDDEMR